MITQESDLIPVKEYLRPKEHFYLKYPFSAQNKIKKSKKIFKYVALSIFCMFVCLYDVAYIEIRSQFYKFVKNGQKQHKTYRCFIHKLKKKKSKENQR